MVEYMKGTPVDKADILDFGNYVFSQAHRPHDFKQMLPKVYGDDVERSDIHYVAKENGRIRAMVASLPMPQTVAGCPLNFGMVGTVSVHPYARGEGHMKKLMAMMMEDQKARGADLLALGGQRQRYGYYGFERAGTVLEYSISEPSMRHGGRFIDTAGIEFREIMSAAEPLAGAAYALYSRQTVTGARPREDYYRIMRSWTGRLYAIMYNGSFAGTLYDAGKESEPGEILLEDESIIAKVLKAWMMLKSPSGLRFSVFPYETERMRLIDGIAENYEICHSELIKVFNWANVIRAYLTLKSRYTTLDDGDTVISVDGARVRIAVSGGAVTVEETDKEAELVMDGQEAVRTLFSVAAFVKDEDTRLHNWAPLPFVLSRCDKF